MSNNRGITLDDQDINWKSNGLEEDIKNESERNYIEIVRDIVSSSKEQLKNQHDNKKSIRICFQIFFTVLLSLQFLAVVAIILISSLTSKFNISDTVIITFITSVFVETLGVVMVMVKFAFDSSQETQILKILNGAISNYQKYQGINKQN